MSAIITNIDRDADLTIHTIEGAFTWKDVIATIDEYYRGQATTFVIWDYSDARNEHCSEDNLKAIARAAGKYVHVRAGGKTALVVPTDLLFGMARVFEALAEAENMPIAIQCFRYISEASAWLKSDVA